MKKISLVLMSVLLVFAGLTPVQAAEKKDTFTVGMECAYAPYNWVESNKTDDNIAIDGGQYCNGYDVQIAKMIAEDMGKELVIQKTTWDGLILSLQSGQIDAIIAGMSPTAERRKEIAFTEPYFLGEDTRFGVVVKSDGKYADVKDISEFEGAIVAGQMGTFHPELAEQIPGVGKVEVMKDFSTMTIALQSGTIDAYICDSGTGGKTNAQHQDIKYIEMMGDDGFQVSTDMISVGIGVNKNNTELLNEINASLSKISVDQRKQMMEDAINAGKVSDNGFFSEVASIVSENWPAFIRGTGTTLLISLSATILGFFIGLLVAISRKNRVLNIIANIYITVFRGTPMMVQAIVMYYGASFAFPNFSWNNLPMGNILAGIIVVSINTGAYMSETIRSGIQAIDKGQFEAAKSMGYTHWETMKEIILPQAIKNVIPAIGNEFIVNIKDTSVLNVISVTELFFVSNGIAASNYKIMQTFLITSCIYLTLTIIISLILKRVELHLDKTKEVATSIPASVTDAKHVNVKGE